MHTMPSQTSRSSTADREIVTTRLIDAPRELVYEAWTDPAHVGHWFGPDGFTVTTRSMDVRPGGTWVFVMHGPDGTDWPNVVTYQEVTPPARLVYLHGDDKEPDMFHNTVTFDDEGGKTALTMRAVFKTAAAREFVVRERGAVEGGKQTVARLDAYVRGLRGSGAGGGAWREHSV
jgi:uncharacterized protein YndB with AHSA1/START domain